MITKTKLLKQWVASMAQVMELSRTLIMTVNNRMKKKSPKRKRKNMMRRLLILKTILNKKKLNIKRFKIKWPQRNWMDGRIWRNRLGIRILLEVLDSSRLVTESILKRLTGEAVQEMPNLLFQLLQRKPWPRKKI